MIFKVNSTFSLSPFMSLVLFIDELHMVTVPSLLGLCRALQGCVKSRRKAFWAMCKPHKDPWKEDDERWQKFSKECCGGHPLFEAVSSEGRKCDQFTCRVLDMYICLVHAWCMAGAF